jgi:hypothetical protein
MMAALGLAETEHLLGVDRQHKWSIPDRKMGMKFLIAIKGGVTQQQWAALIRSSGSGWPKSRP